MGFSAHTINGSVQNIEQGDGKQENTLSYVVSGNQKGISAAFSDLVKSNSSFKGNLTDEEKKAIESVLKELDTKVVFDSAGVKSAGADYWLKKIQTALSCLASVATFANAPWWGIVVSLVTNFISRL